MKIFFILTLTLLCLTSFASDYGDAECRLIAVIDGDTIRCDIDGFPPIIGKNISVRFRGINTPELRGNEKPFGLVSRAKLQEILNKTDRIILKDISRDKYFRIDADIYADGIKINKDELLQP